MSVFISITCKECGYEWTALRFMKNLTMWFHVSVMHRKKQTDTVGGKLPSKYLTGELQTYRLLTEEVFRIAEEIWEDDNE